VSPSEICTPPRHDHLRVLVQHRDHLDLVGGPDLDAEVLGDERRQALKLLGEDRRGCIRGGRVVRVAAAGVCHCRQQLLIEVVAVADGGRADSCARGRGREADHLLRLDARVRGLIQINTVSSVPSSRSTHVRIS
jgi:hypothetical protein